MRFTRKIIILLLGLTVMGLVLSSLYIVTQDYSHDFYCRRGTFSQATIIPAGVDSLTEKSWLTLENTDGFRIECGMLSPRDTSRRYPVIIVLGGEETGKNVVDYARGIRNVIIASPDYGYRKKEDYSIVEFLADVPGIRNALLDVIPSVMLLTDYLFRRSDVDTTRLVLVGYSFGAPFIPCIAAHDRRAVAAVMVYGGGGLRTLIRHNVRRYRGQLASEFVGAMGGVLLYPLEPMRYIEKVSPVHFFMINGTEDEQIPKANAQMLYAQAKEPKKIVWLESGHVSPRNQELTGRIIETLQRELSALNILDSARK
jgi:predicted peptidase